MDGRIVPCCGCLPPNPAAKPSVDEHAQPYGPVHGEPRPALRSEDKECQACDKPCGEKREAIAMCVDVRALNTMKQIQHAARISG